MAQAKLHNDTAWTANSARVAVRVRADWNVDLDYSDAYEDITSRIASVSVDHSLYSQLSGLPLLGDTRPSSATVVLLNEDRWFSPDNAAGLAGTYTNLANGIFRIPITIELGYYYDATPEYLIQFVGEIENVVEQESHGQAQVSMQCTDRSITLLQHKLSTLVTSNVRPDTFMATLLVAAGMPIYSLDQAMTEIPYAWLDDENVWPECQELAAADGGMFYMSKEGTPTFRRMTSVLERTFSTASQAVLNQGNARTYSNAIGWRDCYTGVIMEWAGRYPGTVVELYKAPRPIELPPRDTVTEDVKFRYPAMSVITPVYGVDFQAVTSAPLVAPYTSVSMTTFGQHATLAIWNNMTDATVYVTDLVVRGFPLLGEEAQEKRWNSELSPPLIPGEKVYPVRGNPYMQSLGQVARIGGYLRDRLQRPRRVLQWQGPACPWLELLDRVTLSHNTMTPNPGVNLDCYVVGNSMSYAAGGMIEQTLTLLPVTDLFAYSGYFTMGTSAYADSGSERAAY